jgi:hypothetical protein
LARRARISVRAAIDLHRFLGEASKRQEIFEVAAVIHKPVGAIRSVS